MPEWLRRLLGRSSKELPEAGGYRPDAKTLDQIVPGQFVVPDDFDTMGASEIQDMFEGKP